MRIFGSPHRYYQGPGVFDELGPIVEPSGRTPLVVVDKFMLGVLGERLDATMIRAGVKAEIRGFDGEITYPAIDALIATVVGPKPSAAVGIGGGKALDSAKAVALKLEIPVITVPTAASNDSPTSALIAMYDDYHVMISVDRLPRNPEAVVVDTAIIASAPSKFLRAGIGDAVAKKFEAEGCWNGSGNTPYGTRPLRTALAIADACYRTLLEHAVPAIAAVERKEVDDSLESVVEACLLMSGLGFENGGLSISHSLTRGLVKARGAKNAIHGDQVAYGALVHLAVEGNNDQTIDELMQFYRKIGLPCTLAELGMDTATGEEIRQIATWTMTAPHLRNTQAVVTEQSIEAALLRIEGLARRFGAAA